jgi:nucleoside-diphosphate-sugar epimerase
MIEKILITGACGQIGTELTAALRTKFGNDHVIATDIRKKDHPVFNSGPFEILDVLNENGLHAIIKKYQITQIYHMAAMLSATAEQYPLKGWELNMNSLLYILEASVKFKLNKVFWPSSIGAFGPTTPRIDTPQYTIMDPVTVYGISKKAGEGWCDYYFEKKNVDVRSIRYPGLISYKSPPGGGTTDYAIEIFWDAIQKHKYTSFLSENTMLPMMYMEDAIRGTIEIMETPVENIRVRTSYNFAGFSLTPASLATEIKKEIPEFKIDFNPDSRQQIAESWPASIDDSVARKDWGWKPRFDVSEMTTDMIKNIRQLSLSHQALSDKR